MHIVETRAALQDRVSGTREPRQCVCEMSASRDATWITLGSLALSRAWLPLWRAMNWGLRVLAATRGRPSSLSRSCPCTVAVRSRTATASAKTPAQSRRRKSQRGCKSGSGIWASAAWPGRKAYQVAIPPERGCWATIIGRLARGFAATFFWGCRAGCIFGSGTTTVAISVIFGSKASCS
jgi:hypothetical protein